MRFLVLLFLIVLTFSSCKKEVGPQGPQGNPGKDGVANLYTEIVTIQAKDLRYDDIYKIWYYQHSLPSTFNEKSALVISYLTNNGYQLMPYYDVASKLQLNVSDNSFGKIPYLEFQIENKSSLTERPLNDLKFKVAIIPN